MLLSTKLLVKQPPYNQDIFLTLVLHRCNRTTLCHIVLIFEFVLVYGNEAWALTNIFSNEPNICYRITQRTALYVKWQQDITN